MVGIPRLRRSWCWVALVCLILALNGSMARLVAAAPALQPARSAAHRPSATPAGGQEGASAGQSAAGRVPRQGTSGGTMRKGKSAPAGRAAQAVTGQPLYFAEGYTGQTPVAFHESLTILNTSAMTAFGHIEYYLSTGITSTVAITVPAQRSLIEDVNHDVGPGQEVSAVVSADQPIAALRTIRRMLGQETLAESVTPAVRTLSPVWYFAEGYTGATFQEYLEIFNPSDTAANVMLQPSIDAGASPVAPIARTVPPRSRITVNVNALVRNRSLGMLVQSTTPVLVERTLYWGKGNGSAKFGAAVNAGLTAPAAQWTFSYASVANDDQVYIAAANPTSLEAHVRFTLYGLTGVATKVLTATVEPQSRVTVPITATGGTDRFGVVSSSDVPIICEEAQYLGGSPNNGRHPGNVLQGMLQGRAEWVFPGWSSGSGTYYVLNVGMTSAHLVATLIDMSGQASPVHFKAAAGRLTSITFASGQDLRANSPMVWMSDVPVTMVQVVPTNGTGPDAVILPGLVPAR